MNLKKIFCSKVAVIAICVICCTIIVCCVVIPIFTKNANKKRLLAEENARFEALNRELNNAYDLYYKDVQDESIDDSNAYAHLAGEYDKEAGVIITDIYSKEKVRLVKDDSDESAVYQYQNGRWESVLDKGVSAQTAKYMPIVYKPNMIQTPSHTYLTYGGYRIYLSE